MYYISSFLFIPYGSRVLITSLDEVCFSSFSFTVSIRFNELYWDKYDVVSRVIIYLVSVLRLWWV